MSKNVELREKVIASKTNIIVITGGVCSSIGKGVLVSSMGVLLKNAGYSLTMIKWDPYLNVDPGTMSPLEHGEVFVTADGAETDLDLGHYERLTGIGMLKDSSVSSGQIFQEVLTGEREGRYLGKCIQLVPHVIDVIKQRLLQFVLNHPQDFVLLEIGGTVGDMEGEVFLEAIRQLRLELRKDQLFHGHLSYVPILSWTGEVKTKPTQHSVARLKRHGLVPDALFLRIDKEIGDRAISKTALMCGVNQEYIFQVVTMDIVYNVFLDLDRQGVGKKIQEFFGIKVPRSSDLLEWSGLINKIQKSQQDVSIGLIAKYVGSNDPYISVVEAIKSAGFAYEKRPNVVVIEAEALEKEPYGGDGAAWSQLKALDGIVMPGGFDVRGSEGKIHAARWAREHQVPYLGLCLGLHILLIDFARYKMGLEGANSTEFDAMTPFPVIALLEEQQIVSAKGATMRLGSFPCHLVKGSKAFDAYQKDVVMERHRHRYEVNELFKKQFEQHGIVFSGIYQEKNLAEIAEISDHPFMLGSQFHPEFQSSPLCPHPLFKAFMGAVLEQKKKKR
jgi:CTP synthase